MHILCNYSGVNLVNNAEPKSFFMNYTTWHASKKKELAQSRDYDNINILYVLSDLL